MYAWNLDGVRVSDNITAEFIDQTLVVYGTALFGGDLIPYTHFEWEASPNVIGWVVTVRSLNGRRLIYDGTTQNLVLEVSAAIRRF